MLHTKDFSDYLVSVRGFSNLTAKQYSQCLCKFNYWLQLSRNYDDERSVSTVDVCEFIAWCRNSGLAPKTVNLHRSALASYYRYCVKFHAFAANPVENTEPMKEPRTLPLCVSMEDVERLLSELPDNYSGVLMRALVLSMCHCGLRAAEVCALTVNSLRGDYIVVQGKGNKMRSVPLSIICRNAFADLMRARAVNHLDKTDKLFVTLDAEHFTRSIVYHRIHNLLSKYTDSSLAHPHALRHTFATYCLMRGVTIPQISAWMGHDSYMTTLRYLSVVGSQKNPFDI
jgi:site-specific recombinase XerD